MNSNVIQQQATTTTMAMVVVPQEVWQEVKEDLQEVKELLTAKSTEEAGNEWIESVEARKMLGVSPKTWQTYRDRRIIPFAQIGRKILVRRTDLKAFMEAHYISTDK